MSISETLKSHPWTSINNGYQKCKQLSTGVHNWSLSNDENSDLDLTQFARHIAQQELREDDNTRKDSVEAFRQWISKNKDVRNINMDSCFLSRFLRVKKYSLPLAQDMLLKYLNLRQTYPDYFMNLDCTLPSVNDLINSGYLFASPIRDKMGRRVIFGFADKLDLQKYTKEDLFRVHMITYETILCDEISQITGVVHFADLEGTPSSVITFVSPVEFYRIIRWSEQSMPMRHKEMIFANAPAALRYVYDFFKSILSKKLQARTKLYASAEESMEFVDPKVLPKEFGGIIPKSEMIEMWKKELMQNREKLIALDKMELLNNECILKKKRKTVSKGSEPVTGSFRKLNID